jgi:UDP-glucose 4-epimerase
MLKQASHVLAVTPLAAQTSVPTQHPVPLASKPLPARLGPDCRTRGSHEDHPLSPISADGAGKAAAELYCGTYRALYGVDCRVARLSNPFSAGQNPERGQGAATIFLHRALLHQPIDIWRDGEVMRHYVDVRRRRRRSRCNLLCSTYKRPYIFTISGGQGVA